MYRLVILLVSAIGIYSCNYLENKEGTQELESTEVRPAYLIASSFMEDGHSSLDAYYHAAHPLIEKEGGVTIIAGHSKQERLHFEGTWNEGAAFTVFKFPSMEHLLRFWNSPEYQNVKHLRTDVIPPNFTFATEGFLPSDLEKYIDKK